MNSATKSKPKIRLKLFRGRKVVIDTTRRKKQTVQALIKNKKWTRAYLKVTYGYGRTNLSEREEIYNEGDYTNKAELMKVLRIFCSSMEVRDYEENFKT